MCNAFVLLDKYKVIVTVTSHGAVQQVHNRAESVEWLDGMMNINRMQQHDSSQHYNNMSNDGAMVRSGSVVNGIYNEGALAQSFGILEKPPAHGVVCHLCTVIDRVQHPEGPSFTNFGDVNVHGRASAASAHVANNNLELDEMFLQTCQIMTCYNRQLLRVMRLEGQQQLGEYL